MCRKANDFLQVHNETIAPKEIRSSKGNQHRSYFDSKQDELTKQKQFQLGLIGLLFNFCYTVEKKTEEKHFCSHAVNRFKSRTTPKNCWLFTEEPVRLPN